MSNNKTISKKTGVTALAGLAIAAAMIAAITLQPAMTSAQAEERSDRAERKIQRADDVRDIRPGIISAKGVGVATDQETGENLRSGFRFLLQKVNGTENEFDVKRGLIGLFVEGQRVHYTAVPDTWTVVLSDDRLTFRATGQVENEGDTFEVNLQGYFGMHTRLGNLWSIQGEMEGREHQYDLHYVGISHGLRAAGVDDRQ